MNEVGVGGEVPASKLVDFGRFLKSHRERRGLSIDDVARSTKIPPTLVSALEEGHAERFPEKVFLLNYIRSYAGAVGIQTDDAIHRYQQIPALAATEQFDPSKMERGRRERRITTAWLVIAGVWVTGALIALQSMSVMAAQLVNR